MAVSESESIGSYNADENCHVQSQSLQEHQQEKSSMDAFSSSSSLNKQNSFFSLTIDEIQCKSGMNMEEFLASIWNVEENQAACKKPADELWFEIHKNQRPLQEGSNIVANFEPECPKSSFGEITLEDFLVKAGVVKESSQAIRETQQCANTFLDQQCGMEQMMSSGFSIHNINVENNGSEFQTFEQSSVVEQKMDSINTNEIEKCDSVRESSNLKNKRKIINEVVIQRRQRRMIRNRESAARSRARKQAYIVELEIELEHLQEENENLKKIVAEIERKQKQEIMKKKESTKAHNLSEKLRSLRRALSLDW